MNTQKITMKEILIEIKETIINFFKWVKPKDEIFKLPKSLFLMNLKIGTLDTIETVVIIFLAFLLQISNELIVAKYIVLGIIFFMLYKGRYIVTDTFNLYFSNERKKFDLIFDNELILSGSKIVGIVSNKILKKDKEKNIYVTMSNEAVINCLKRYLGSLWSRTLNYPFDIFEVVSIIVMIVIAIVTNNTIPQKIFIPLLLIFGILTFVTSAYVNILRKNYHKERRELEDYQYTISNDLLRVPAIVKNDLPMRINKFQETINKNKNINVNLVKKRNLFDWFLNFVQLLAQYGLIVFYVYLIGISNFSLSSITEITATLVIVEEALRKIRNLSSFFAKTSEINISIKQEEEDIDLILDVYYKEVTKIKSDNKIDDITISPMELKYIIESENDVPFTLKVKDDIKINTGEVVILTGISGSGKSTFMKILTEKIKVEKTAEIPSTSRYLFYDEKLRFGSLFLYEELFAQTKPNLEKMEQILKNLHLYEEIKENCIDVLEWLKQKRFENSLSNGQKQRLILAKLLYFLDEDIDVVVFDECTSGLDEKSKEDSADATRVLEYIVRYCNSDKKRIVILSTHQNIEEVKNNLRKDFLVREFYFEKNMGESVVKEVK